MKSNKLALFGGNKTINYKINKYNSISKEELKAAQKVIKKGLFEILDIQKYIYFLQSFYFPFPTHQ